MINFDSQVKISTTQADTTLTLGSATFDQSLYTLVIPYEASKPVAITEEIVIVVNRF